MWDIHRSKWDENIKMIIRKIQFWGWTLDWTNLQWVPVAGFCKHNDELLSFTTIHIFLTSWMAYQLLKEDLLYYGVSYLASQSGVPLHNQSDKSYFGLWCHSTTWCYNPEDHEFNLYHENLVSWISQLVNLFVKQSITHPVSWFVNYC